MLDGVLCSDLLQHSDGVPFRSLLSTETSEDTDPAAQRYSSLLLIVLFMGCGWTRWVRIPAGETKCPLGGYRWSGTAGVAMKTNFYTVPKLRKGGAVPTFPLQACIVCIRTPLPLRSLVLLHLIMLLTTTLSMCQILWRHVSRINEQ